MLDFPGLLWDRPGIVLRNRMITVVMSETGSETGSENGRKAARLRIDGRVQGVWFRGWTVDQATRLGLDGWVRNRSDGSVEALVAGPPDAVETMIRACRRGPDMAKVIDVSVSAASDPGPVGFTQAPTV